ncbi:MAG: NAD-dependent epimerase/dehydratase family protein [candidate division NC10 bacterium]|nr:NAD-dependent epimerase/dehydratase family protein [candidate division NC10 bacterium]
MGRPRSLVTGAAGFIGSHLSRRLLAEGHEVIGLDGFTDYYPRWLKERNLQPLLSHPAFSFLDADLLRADLEPLIRTVDYVFHQAAQPGVRGSWGKGFEPYVDNNVKATQRLLEAVKEHGEKVKHLVYASSSSVYGNAPELPLHEEVLPRPFSPYGVTKLAAEYLSLLYHENDGLPVTALRYFTVYGPGQRPDMAFHKFLKALFAGEEILIYGDGEQTRDFTYISDAVEANLLALKEVAVGKVFNVGGGSRVTVNAILRLLQEITGVKPRVRYQKAQRGDMRHTTADIRRAREILGFSPKVSLEEGLKREAAWVEETFFQHDGPCHETGGRMEGAPGGGPPPET